jgi:hypothetical protein
MHFTRTSNEYKCNLYCQHNILPHKLCFITHSSVQFNDSLMHMYCKPNTLLLVRGEVIFYLPLNNLLITKKNRYYNTY